MDTSRNELIWGKENQDLLKTKHVAVFGLGGVGGFALESLARSGVGAFTIVDFDTVSKSNINRQLIALNSTIGKKKTEIFKELCFEHRPDYDRDAIDTMRSKIDLLVYCYQNKIPVITSMGAGNRFDPTQLYITDISQIENKKCTFTKNVLYQLKKRGIESGITAVCSRETPKVLDKISVLETITTKSGDNIEFTKITPGSTPFVPAVAGYYLGWYVLKHFLSA